YKAIISYGNHPVARITSRFSEGIKLLQIVYRHARFFDKFSFYRGFKRFAILYQSARKCPGILERLNFPFYQKQREAFFGIITKNYGIYRNFYVLIHGHIQM